MPDEKSVVVVGEIIDGVISRHTRELLGGARAIADELNCSLDMTLLGDDIAHAAREAFAYGADRVHLLINPLLEAYHPELWLKALVEVLKGLQPEAVLLGQTAIGRDLGPRLAQRLNTGIAMDCVAISVDDKTKKLRMTRPVFGGKALATLVCKQKPQVATVRAKAMKALEPDQSRQGELTERPVALNDSIIRARVVERVKEQRDGVPFDEAKVVVSGGRGIGGKEGFIILDEVAALFKGATGASRPPCDSGWVPHSKQVGLTGKIIRPDLYIAVALSGSSQHMAGCQDSKTIIAINKDSQANIFSFAHYGIVEDYKNVLPHLLQKLKERI
jgi:electron transfer flavoprotein alpha subunit